MKDQKKTHPIVGLFIRSGAWRRPYKKFGSSPNSLIEYFMKTCQGPGRKVRLRRKHRRDMDFHNLPACLPQSAAGAGKENFDEGTEHPRHT